MWALRAQLLERGREGACGIWFQKVGEDRKAWEILQASRKTLWSKSWGELTGRGLSQWSKRE